MKNKAYVKPNLKHVLHEAPPTWISKLQISEPRNPSHKPCIPPGSPTISRSHFARSAFCSWKKRSGRSSPRSTPDSATCFYAAGHGTKHQTNLQMIGNHRKPGNRDGQIASNSNWAKWPTFSFWPNSGWNLENLWVIYPRCLEALDFLCPETDGFPKMNPLCEPFFLGKMVWTHAPFHLGLYIWAWFEPQNFWGWISRTTCHYGVIRIIEEPEPVFHIWSWSFQVRMEHGFNLQVVLFRAGELHLRQLALGIQLR